ncbi:TonB-dependent receptor [Campylobacter sp. CCS1377]|uniref:TonB-dependent receptor n=1 Tax=Campylobacter sp. CCS1377 TaxID=3158229 RepID=A0AAU7E6E7_9BACT
MNSIRFLKFSLLAFLFINAYAEDKAVLDKVIVSANGFEQDADSNLRNVIVVEGKDLQNKGYTSVEQALQRVGGISFASLGVNGNTSRNIDLRGQGKNANAAVKLMLDGIALNALDQNRLHASGTNFKPLDSVALEDIERIEIIPGGGAVLYGNGTRGGVINIITKKNKQTKASLNFKESAFDNGNFGTQLGLNTAIKITPQAAFNVTFEGFNTKSNQEGSKQKGFYQNSKFLYDINDDMSINFNFSYYKNDDENSGFLTKEQAESNPHQRGDSATTFKIEKPQLSTEFKYKINDKLDLHSVIFWQKQKTKIEETDTGVYSKGSNFEDILQGINLKNKFSYGENSYLVYGYEFAQHKSKAFSDSLIGTTTSNDRKDTHSVFILDSHEFSDYLILSAGARYEYADYKHHGTGSGYNFNSDNINTDNFALELTPTLRYSDTGRTYIKFERGFVSPTPYQFRARKQENGNTIYFTNSNLKSETYNTYELGLKDYLWDFNEINIALFYTQSKDEINSYGSLMSEYGYKNLDETRRYGFELGLRQDFEKVSFYQNIAFVDAEISVGADKGKDIPLVSKTKATAGVEYYFYHNLIGFLDLSYFSKAKDESDADIDEYLLTDLGLIYTYKNMQVNLGIKNLFDEKYYTYQNAASNQYLVGNGRSYYIGLNYKF